MVAIDGGMVAHSARLWEKTPNPRKKNEKTRQKKKKKRDHRKKMG
jgi:hypothetical protein